MLNKMGMGMGKSRKIQLLLCFLPLVLLLILAGCTVAPGSNTSVIGGGTSVSNGQRIFQKGTSNSGQSISYTGGPGMMMGSALTCATCHGASGRGGTVVFMMQSYDVPNITWPVLSGPDPEMDHPPYTEDTLKQAIAQGKDPGGNALEYPMPRWNMSPQDLNDLVTYIETLK